LRTILFIFKLFKYSSSLHHVKRFLCSKSFSFIEINGLLPSVSHSCFVGIKKIHIGLVTFVEMEGIFYRVAVKLFFGRYIKRCLTFIYTLFYIVLRNIFQP